MSDSSSLVARWRVLAQTSRNLRQRDAAARLGVTEAELVAGMGASADPAHPRVTRLRPDWSGIFGALQHAGRVMALTRNGAVVSETKGLYGGVDLAPHGGVVLGEGIDLRVFTSQWSSAFRVHELTPDGERVSLQLYDASGVAVHKVFSLAETGPAPLAEALLPFSAPWAPVAPVPREAPLVRADAKSRTGELRAAWRALEDTHDFFPLLRRLGLQREEALRLAGPELAEPLALHSWRRVFEESSTGSLPIMVFVGNPGMIQIFTGVTTRLRVVGTWFNVLDPDFNLHLDEAQVATAWRVRKPTRDGVVTSVELFDDEGRNVALLFGERKPGRPETVAWRELAEGLPVRPEEGSR